jgi:hypothetical protein
VVRRGLAHHGVGNVCPALPWQSKGRAPEPVLGVGDLGGSFVLTLLTVPAPFKVVLCHLLRYGAGPLEYVSVPVPNVLLFDLGKVAKIQKELSEFLVPGFVMLAIRFLNCVIGLLLLLWSGGRRGCGRR